MERRQGRTVSIGRQNYADIREHGSFYVDKTAFIREWWEADDQVTLIARPRRFGKTLNMSMLECFFSLKYAGRSDLFEGLDVWRDSGMRALQGTAPVVSLTFSSVKDRTFEGAMAHIRDIISCEYKLKDYLLDGDLLSDAECEAFLSVNRGMGQETTETSLKNLCIWLERAHGVRPIVLLDEYDAPMQEAWTGGYWDDMCAFMRSFLNATFKANPSLGRGLLTGVTRVSKESIFSGLNNLGVVSTLTRKYETAFGFTEDEVFAALDEMGMGECKDEARRWYDGFTFGCASGIYNPWSITNYLDERRPGCYWANTSSNALVDELVRTGGPELQSQMEELLRGGSIRMEYDDQIDFRHLADTPDSVWNLLLATGYLRVSEQPTFSGEGGCDSRLCSVALTNLETRDIFERLVRGWFAGGKARREYNEFVRCLLAGDVAGMEEFLNEVAVRSFSFFDVGGEGGAAPGADDGVAASERFYHGFVLGLLVELQGRYELTSNRESGYGRYDVVLRPLRSGDPAYVLEFKALNPRREESLENALAAAKAQIAERAYAEGLVAAGIERDRIRELGIAFQGKRCIIG